MKNGAAYENKNVYLKISIYLNRASALYHSGQCYHYIETSPLIYWANQWDVFYIMATMDWNKLILTTMVIRNGKMVWKHGLIIDIFAWTWNIWDGGTENTSKQRKMVAFMRNCSVKITLRLFQPLSVVMTMVATLEAVQKIATNPKDYHKYSSCVTVCWIVKIYQSITVKKGWLPPYLLGHLRRLKRAIGGAIIEAITGKRSNNWPRVSFIHNGSEITTKHKIQSCRSID